MPLVRNAYLVTIYIFTYLVTICIFAYRFLTLSYKALEIGNRIQKYKSKRKREERNNENTKVL